MIREHTVTVANNNCVVDCIMLEEIISAYEMEEVIPKTTMLSSSPSSRLTTNETDIYQEGECTIVDCHMINGINTLEEKNISTETAASSPASPREAVANSKKSIIAAHRAAADLAATESEYRNHRNDITHSYLRCHSCLLLSGMVYISFVIIIICPICIKVGSEKGDCEKMLFGLSLSALSVFSALHMCLCCLEKTKMCSFEENHSIDQ